MFIDYLTILTFSSMSLIAVFWQSIILSRIFLSMTFSA